MSTYLDTRFTPEGVTRFVQKAYGYVPTREQIVDFISGLKNPGVQDSLRFNERETPEEVLDLYFNPESGEVMRWADIVGYNHSNWSGYLDEGKSASGGFDLKSFMINEGLTRVSQDRKRLLKETGPADWTEEDKVWIDLADWWSSLYFRLVGYANADADYDGPRTEILQIGNYIVTADLESDDDSPEKGNTYINGQEATTEEIAKIVKLIESYVDAHKMNQIKLSVVTDDDLNEESDRELATRVSKIVHADPKRMTNGVRRKSNGSTTAGNWNGMGSANQDAEHRKEQSKQNANLKKQLGIKTKPMSREDWITKKLNKELGL